MKKILIYFFGMVLSITAFSQSAPIKQKIEFKIDDIGDALIRIEMKMNAQAWQMWSQQFANNEALLKRNIERTLPGYFMDDFELEKDAMERTAVVSFKAYGVCKVDKKGRWFVELDEKDVEVTEMGDRKYMIAYNQVSDGIQQTQIIEFPPSAKNIEVDTDAYGASVFEFKMAGSGMGFDWMRVLGGVFLIGGIAGTSLMYWRKNKTAV